MNPSSFVYQAILPPNFALPVLDFCFIFLEIKVGAFFGGVAFFADLGVGAGGFAGLAGAQNQDDAIAVTRGAFNSLFGNILRLAVCPPVIFGMAGEAFRHSITLFRLKKPQGPGMFALLPGAIDSSMAKAAGARHAITYLSHLIGFAGQEFSRNLVIVILQQAGRGRIVGYFFIQDIALK